MLSVLVIDDEPDLLELVRHFLERFGDMKIETSLSCKEALGIVARKEYDAIVVDYYMPEITGIDFLKILRAKGDTTPIIIFTGVGREHAAIEAINNGADFFLQKGDDPKTQFRELVHMIRQAMERRSVGRSPGTSQRIITDVTSFSPEAMVAIDREGMVIAWNTAMEELSGVPATAMIKWGDYAYAEPFFGRKQRMLIDLVFEKDDDDIQKQNYLLVSRVKKGPVIAVTKGKKADGTAWTLWMKAMPLYDVRGNYIASIGSVRDITATVKDVPFPDAAADAMAPAPLAASAGGAAPAGGLLDRILGKATSHYKEGVLLYGRDRNFRETIAAFDKTLEIDNTLAHVCNDRGICYRELGKYDEALKSFLRAVELTPDTAEVLYDLGETLEKIGVLQRDNKYLDAALQTFHMVVDKLPNIASAWNHIGVCMMEMGRAEESKIYFDRTRDVRMWKKDTPIPRKRDEYLHA